MLKQKKIKKKSCFHAYGQVFQKKFFLYHIFIKKKTIQKHVLACILTLITSLLKSRQLDQYFKNFKNIFHFLLILKISNLHVRHIHDIKNIVLLYIDFRTVKFYPVR